MNAVKDSMHHFDPGPSGIETRCQHRLPSERPPFSRPCLHPKYSPVGIHYLPDPECEGCLSGYDIGLPSADIAYPHPECPVHGDPAIEPLSPEEEEIAQALHPDLPLHRTEASTIGCSTCDGGGCPDCTDPA